MGKVIGIALIDRKGGPVVVHSSAKVTIEKGVGDDHRGRDVENKDRQVSVIAQEDWDIVCSELGTKLHWTTRKANIMVSGVDLVDSIGDVLKIGNFYIEITGKMLSGSSMDEQFLGLKDALAKDWRSGVVGKVLNDGFINENDLVTMMERA
jgi:MOSC domain-containing protein YiiM